MALRIAQHIKSAQPPGASRHVLGGGCQHRAARAGEPRLFDYVDVITLDAGERPLLALIEHPGGGARATLVRAFVREGEGDRRAGALHHLSGEPDIAFAEVGTPDLGRPAAAEYLSLLDMLNPDEPALSDGRWNKLTVAHGCYWKKCSFCDVNLDYISRYERRPPSWSTASSASSPRPARPASTSSTRRAAEGALRWRWS